MKKNITIVAIYGAIILPTLAQTLPKPTPTFLITVGNTSLLYRYIVGKLSDIPARPNVAKSTVKFEFDITASNSKLAADRRFPLIRILKRDTRDIKNKTTIVPGSSTAAENIISNFKYVSLLNENRYYIDLPDTATFTKMLPSI